MCDDPKAIGFCDISSLTTPAVVHRLLHPGGVHSEEAVVI